MTATSVAHGCGDYAIAAEIGRGAYGTVYRAHDMRNEGRVVAMKEIRIHTSSEEGMPMSTIREIAMLKQLESFEHPNIVRLLDVIVGTRSSQEMRLNLVFEHVDQDLSHYIANCPQAGLGPDRIKDLTGQMIEGVEFLHTNRIVHRDLKPQNILVTNQGKVKLADFGLARVYGFQMALTSVVVTLYYRSPEVLLQDSYCTAVDIWSCGCIFAELYLRKPLFAGTSEIDQLCKIFELMGLPEEADWPVTVSLPRSSFRSLPKQPLERMIPGIDPEAKDLLEKMLIFDQNARISATEIKKHCYLGEDLDVSMSSASDVSFTSSYGNLSGDNLSSPDHKDHAPTHPSTLPGHANAPAHPGHPQAATQQGHSHAATHPGHPHADTHQGHPHAATHPGHTHAHNTLSLGCHEVLSLGPSPARCPTDGYHPGAPLSTAHVAVFPHVVMTTSDTGLRIAPETVKAPSYADSHVPMTTCDNGKTGSVTMATYTDRRHTMVTDGVAVVTSGMAHMTGAGDRLVAVPQYGAGAMATETTSLSTAIPGESHVRGPAAASYSIHPGSGCQVMFTTGGVTMATNGHNAGGANGMTSQSFPRAESNMVVTHVTASPTPSLTSSMTPSLTATQTHTTETFMTGR